jgi:hypothetical protein
MPPLDALFFSFVRGATALPEITPGITAKAGGPSFVCVPYLDSDPCAIYMTVRESAVV